MVMEVVDILGMNGSLVELKDGALLSNDGRISRDGGETWSEPRSFGEGISGNSITRLASGALALVSPLGFELGEVWHSHDEAKTWKGAGHINAPAGSHDSEGDTMIQLGSGRLLYCWYNGVSGIHPDLSFEAKVARGRWRGKRYDVEGHGHIPEMGGTGVSWSDDEGKTWHYCSDDLRGPSILFGWFDFKGEPNGMCGCTPCLEPSIAETGDGRVLLFGRSTVGRIVTSVSNDGGESWSALRPTDLAASNSPPRLRRIPETGDLLCVWNQVSGEEIRRGFRRGRLSAAISRDRGVTWGNFKTIEVSEGLQDAVRVEPDPEIRMVRARQDVGSLPDGFAMFHYCNVRFARNKVYLMYIRGNPEVGNAEQASATHHRVLRIYPLEWFYN